MLADRKIVCRFVTETTAKAVVVFETRVERWR